MKNFDFPGISVVIPTYNNGRTIEECINSVLKTQYPTLEVIVVNDGSTDDTLKRLYRFRGKIKIINQKNTGKPTALNNGINHSKNPIVFILDGDTFVDENCLKEIVSSFDKDTGAVACKYTVANKGFLPSLENIFMIFGSLSLRFQNIFESATIRGCAAAINKKAFENVNGFDQVFDEDTEFALKLLKNGWKVKYSSSSITRTFAHTNFIKLFLKKIDESKASIEVVTKYWGTFLKRPCLLFSLVNYIFLIGAVVILLSTIFRPSNLMFLISLVKNFNSLYIVLSFSLINIINALSNFLYSFPLFGFTIFIYFYLVSKIEKENLFSLSIIPYLMFYSPVLFISFCIGTIIGSFSFLSKTLFHRHLYRS